MRTNSGLGFSLFLFLCLFLFFVLELAQLEAAFRNRLQLLALELGEMPHYPFVDAIGHQQHLNTFFAEHFQMRAVLRRRERFGGDIIDFFLLRFHAGNVIG